MRLEVGRCPACGATIRPGKGDWCRCLHCTRDEWKAWQEAANRSRNTDAPVHFDRGTNQVMLHGVKP